SFLFRYFVIQALSF
ncbi:gntP permease family protein, partial [Vibrio parahaemolyticus V-223/04]